MARSSRRVASRAEQLGLRAGLGDRLLPLLVGAMSFLAALAIGGAVGASILAGHWQGATGAALTVQVPDPDQPAAGGGTRGDAAAAALLRMKTVAAVERLTGPQVDALLAPWLGAGASALALPLPAVFSGRLVAGGIAPVQAALAAVAPGAEAQAGALWADRVVALTASVQASAGVVLLIVAFVATAVVAVATRAGLAQRRDAIRIVHGLGGLDADIAAGFSIRALRHAVEGALAGALLAVPVLYWFSVRAAPFSGALAGEAGPVLPATLWLALPALPLAAAAIGWGTAQLTVRNWLRKLG